ncbi:aminoglycoside 3'-phosphotransferase [Rhodococcoides kyotonense]|nr:aminoglycoside 3'-phosphotransferase [Rhodococcus kyotonensis]
MTRPDPRTTPPPAVRQLAGERSIAAVWRNEIGGTTFRLEGTSDELYVKWSPANSDVDLAEEAEKLTWASTYVRVPEVLGHGSDTNGQWLATRALPGTNAVDERWVSRPEEAAHAIGLGLRAFHDSIPTDRCPFDWSIERRLDHARQQGLSPEVGTRPFDLDLVVCHGDACAPNTLLDAAGTVTGHVDLGRMGLADRWADLAPAIMSTEWNYGRTYTDDVLAGYGIELDRDRFEFYSRLWSET